MEVLQTSALPLGDGAARTQADRRHNLSSRTRGCGGMHLVPEPRVRDPTPGRGISSAALLPSHKCPIRSLVAPCRPSAARQALGRDPAVRTRARKMERETGFEPATSTLARSHSTTELFPPRNLRKLRYHSVFDRIKTGPSRSRRPPDDHQGDQRRSQLAGKPQVRRVVGRTATGQSGPLSAERIHDHLTTGRPPATRMTPTTSKRHGGSGPHRPIR